ncbi:hypothetical protein IEQ34_012332 [Dendrobium chrysotoxum]|uniref:Uncharacterized protein n=1 Tax=Dendrobium chrysotoxum TaxID=161865 RepID=A0AAV7GUY8_DENCH|nr:hypothetical protein IEQ34_012332 [Dendrobium chrysotoxum]
MKPISPNAFLASSETRQSLEIVFRADSWSKISPCFRRKRTRSRNPELRRWFTALVDVKQNPSIARRLISLTLVE